MVAPNKLPHHETNYQGIDDSPNRKSDICGGKFVGVFVGNVRRFDAIEHRGRCKIIDDEDGEQRQYV